MNKRPVSLAALCLAIFSFVAALPVKADELSQNFNTWTMSPATSTNAGWSYGASSGSPQISTAVVLSSPRALLIAPTVVNAYLELPYVTNGAGTLTYWCRPSPATNVTVQSSPDRVTWTTRYYLPTTNANYRPYSVVLNDYGSNYYRITLPGVQASFGTFFEDVSLNNPQAKVEINSATAQTTVGSPDIFTGDPANITASFTPYGIVSNLQMTLYWKFGWTGPTNSITMTNISSTSFRTATPIGGQAAGKVYYYVSAAFNGPPPNGAASPTNYPTATGFTNTFYYSIEEREYAIQYRDMVTTGTLASTMNTVKDNEWESFISYTGSTFSFQFQAVSNLTTLNWGDAAQSGTTPPFEQGADLNQASIQVTPSATPGQLVVRFKELTSQYMVKEAVAETFDAWTAPVVGSYTNSANWVLVNGQVAYLPEVRLRNGYAVLTSNTTSWLQSPYLPGGIGEVSFWCRNANTNGSPTAGLRIEKSITGVNDWVEIAATNGLALMPFQRMTVILSDRDSHYIRIRNTTNFPNAGVCLDEVMVAKPGAGVQFSGTTNTPASPAATNPVAISSTITAVGGASNLVAKVWYRSGSTGMWSSIAMTNAGAAFGTITNIPAGKGDLPGGAGTVNYYIECGFQGFDSAFATPFFYPAAGSNAPLSYQVSRATVEMSNPLTDPALPVIGSPTRLSVDLATLNGASNVVLTAYYRLNGSSYSPLTMSRSNNTYRTDGAIPAQSTAGTFLEYYYTATFQGPSAVTPTNYPVTWQTAPFSATIRQLMQNSSMVVTGGVVSAMYVIDANLWETFVPYTGVSVSVKFNGYSNGTTRLWGDASQSVTTTPFSLNADLGAGFIQVAPTTNTGTLLFRFSEANRDYTIKQAEVQPFDAWVVPTVGNSTNAAWRINQGLTASNTLSLRNRYLALESNTTSWIVSPYLAGGIGEISFWHRNANSSDSPAAGLVVEKSVNGGTNASDWVYLATVTNISYSEYRRFTLVHPDRNAFYVRVRNSSAVPNARVCLDELIIAQPGAGVLFTNVTLTPASPAASNTVSVSVTILPAGNASNLAAKVWYRSGSTGTWAWVSMNKSVNSFTTATPIPAGIGDKVGGAGLVQYYLECSYLGYESALSSPLLHPAPGAVSPLSYTVQSSWLLATNAATEPFVPLTSGSTRLRIDLLPQAGASGISATAWYRFGGVGSYSPLGMTLLSNSTYQTTAALPAQPIAGKSLQYYFTASFSGPDPATPTNSPANAPVSFYSALYQTPAWTSEYSAVTITGDVFKAMTRSSNESWRAILTVTNASNTRFRFSGAGLGSPLWGTTNQTGFSLPVYGAAAPGGGVIVMTGTVSSSLVFQFNDSNLDYSAQRAAYSDVTAWPTSNSWTTNTAGWVLKGRASRSNDSDDLQRVFDGSYLILQGGSATNFLRSPAMTNGIGEVSFFYRNWDASGSNPVSFVVEASPTNNSTTTGWTTLQQVTNLLAFNYQFFRTVLPDPFTNRYIRIRNTSSAMTDRLCIDETIVSDSGSYLVFSSPARTPAAPTVQDIVNVSVTITPRGGATNLTPVLWYKATTNAFAFYQSTSMSNISGNVYGGTVPRGPIGPMFYYFESAYSGFLYSQPQRYPAEGSAPLSYTNSDGGLFESFDTWASPTPSSSIVSFTNNGWQVYNAMYSSAFSGAPGSTARALWLEGFNNRTLGNDGTAIISPLVTNLYGTVHMTFWMNVLNSTNSTTVGIYTTSDPDPVLDNTDTNVWTLKDYVSCNTVANNWLSKGPISFTNNLFRILIIKEAGNNYIGIDQVEIAQQSSMITFTNLYLSPGYPSTNEEVLVSVTVNSFEPGMPAYNFRPTLHYNNGGPNYFLGVMGRVPGTLQFTNTIPASKSLWDTNTFFYVSCEFDGYAHSPLLDESPMLYPTNFNVEPFSYRPRLKPSDYGTLYTSGNRGTATMELLENYIWQGILRIDSTVPNMTFNFSGYNYFTGTGFSANPTNWGQPTDQWKTNLPLADIALSTNFTSILASGPLKGQYVTRIHERTGDFTLQACVAQNFESWPPTTLYMASGNSESDIFTNNFNTLWPMNVMNTRFDNFQVNWTNSTGVRGITYYTNQWYGGTANWGIYDAMIPTTNAANNSYGVMITSNANVGRVMNNQANTPLEGIGTISFWYKAVDTNIPTTIEVNLAPVGSNENPTTWERIAVISNIYTSATNIFTMVVNTSAYRSVIIEHASGEARLMLDELRVTDFAATYHETNGWIGSEIWMQPQTGNRTLNVTNDNNSAIQFEARRFNADAYLQSPLMTNGIGFFDFWYKSATNTQEVSFDVMFYRGATGEKLDSVTNNSAAYQSYSLTVMTTNSGYIRLVPTSTNSSSILFVDDVRITGIPPVNTWQANNARVASEDDRRFRGSAIYLNNGLTDIMTNLTFINDWPYIKTPEFTKGVGEISFWYRNHALSAPTPGTLIVQTSVNNSNWTDVATINNIVNTKTFQYYRTNLYDNSIRYVRWINPTNLAQKARIILDEILVTQPMAADINLPNMRISPEAPVPTNTVHVFVDVKDQFLYPSNLALAVVYSVGTNYGDWGSTNPILDMALFSNNVQTRTLTYRTIEPIPGQPADSFVQYQVLATFSGLNAQGNTSPKWGRSFSTPRFYYPLNYGTDMPYYIVFSTPTNSVWINEIDPGWNNWFSTAHKYDFVEVAGHQGIDISKWKILFFAAANPTQAVATYTFANSPATVFQNMTNGIGFFMIGKTTLPVTPTIVLTNNIPYPGGVALQRPLGMYSDKLCFANLPSQVSLLTATNFLYIGKDEDGYNDAGGSRSIILVGTGSVSTAFTWKTTTRLNPVSTPLAANWLQTIPAISSPVNNPPAEVTILDFQIYNQEIWLTVNGTNNWLPTPMFRTNLTDGSSTNIVWTNAVPNFNRSALDTTFWTYDLSFPLPTNRTPFFYRVVTTNASN